MAKQKLTLEQAIGKFEGKKLPAGLAMLRETSKILQQRADDRKKAAAEKRKKAIAAAEKRSSDILSEPRRSKAAAKKAVENLSSKRTGRRAASGLGPLPLSSTGRAGAKFGKGISMSKGTGKYIPPATTTSEKRKKAVAAATKAGGGTPIFKLKLKGKKKLTQSEKDEFRAAIMSSRKRWKDKMAGRKENRAKNREMRKLGFTNVTIKKQQQLDAREKRLDRKIKDREMTLKEREAGAKQAMQERDLRIREENLKRELDAMNAPDAQAPAIQAPDNVATPLPAMPGLGGGPLPQEQLPDLGGPMPDFGGGPIPGLGGGPMPQGPMPGAGPEAGAFQMPQGNVSFPQPSFTDPAFGQGTPLQQGPQQGPSFVTPPGEFDMYKPETYGSVDEGPSTPPPQRITKNIDQARKRIAVDNSLAQPTMSPQIQQNLMRNAAMLDEAANEDATNKRKVTEGKASAQLAQLREKSSAANAAMIQRQQAEEATQAAMNAPVDPLVKAAQIANLPMEAGPMDPRWDVLVAETAASSGGGGVDRLEAYAYENGTEGLIQAINRSRGRVTPPQEPGWMSQATDYVVDKYQGSSLPGILDSLTGVPPEIKKYQRATDPIGKLGELLSR